MRVPVLKGPRKIEWENKLKPVVGPAEILVKVEYCGICGSDAHGYDKGIVIPAGTVLGHEFSGVVAEAGEKVRDFRPGGGVVVKPLILAGPETAADLRNPILNIEQLLGVAVGISPKHDGAFAEYVKIPYPDLMAFHLPPSVSFMDAALIEPLAVSLHGVRLSRLKPGARAVVIGGGMIGLGAIQFLRLGGAGRIIVLEVSSEKSRIAEKLGAHAVVNPLDERENTKEKVLNLTDGIGADIVLECSGAPSALQNSIRYVKRGGQIIVIGLHETEVPFDFFWMLHWELEMKGSLAYDYDEFKYVIEFLEKRRLQTEPLITDTIRLAELEEKGLKRMISSRDVVKILVKP
jgi:threonine dehydrogenase-like Zn-dependent dehydrogenase